MPVEGKRKYSDELRSRDDRDSVGTQRSRDKRDRDWRSSAADRERDRNRSGDELRRDRDPYHAVREPDREREHKTKSGSGSRSYPPLPLPPRRASQPGSGAAGAASSAPPRRLPAVGPGSVLAAEAARLVREKQARSHLQPDGSPGSSGAEDGGEPEEGQYVEPGELGHDSKRSRHEPIVWHTPPKSRMAPDVAAAHVRAANAAHLDKVESTSRLASSSPAALPAAASAAQRAALELEQFRLLRQGDARDAEGPAAMKASPSVSDGDDPLQARLAAEASSAERKGSGSGEGRAARATNSRPAISSRWLDADAEGEGGADNKEELDDAAAERALNERERQELAEADNDAPAGGAEDVMRALRSSERMDSGDESEDVQPLSPASQLNNRISMLQECRSVDEAYERLNHISEGTYGIVYRARDRKTGRICALKKVKMENQRDGFPVTTIREVNILLSFHHRNIVNVSEVVVGRTLDSVYMVMEFMEHDLKGLMDEMPRPFSVSEVKTLMRQLLDGINYLHENWVLHRDLKTSNILYNNRGELKICDFGMARQYGSPLRPYTHMVVTLWYRAPELLLGAKVYSTAVDMWSLGCIMAELLTKKTLFPGEGELPQLKKIFDLLGTPNEQNWPGYKKLPNLAKIDFKVVPDSKLRKKFPPLNEPDFGASADTVRLSDNGFDLLSRMLALNPEARISAAQALAHPWFSETPLPKDQELMPTFPTRKDGSTAPRPRALQASPDPRLAAAGGMGNRRQSAGMLANAAGGIFNYG